MINRFSTMLRDDAGQGLVEYALIIALVSIVAITALRFLGNRTSDTFKHAAGSLGNGNSDQQTSSQQLSQ